MTAEAWLCKQQFSGHKGKIVFTQGCVDTCRGACALCLEADEEDQARKLFKLAALGSWYCSDVLILPAPNVRCRAWFSGLQVLLALCDREWLKKVDTDDETPLELGSTCTVAGLAETHEVPYDTPEATSDDENTWTNEAAWAIEKDAWEADECTWESEEDTKKWDAGECGQEGNIAHEVGR